MEGRWSCELQEVTALVPSSSGHSHSQNFSPGLHPRPKVGGGSAPRIGSGVEVSAVFAFFKGRSKQRLGCPQTAVQFRLRSEQVLEAEPRSSVFWGRNLASSPSAEGKGGGACGKQGWGAGFHPPLHPWPLTSWALTWPAGALQPALLWTQNFEQVFPKGRGDIVIFLPSHPGCLPWAGCRENSMVPIPASELKDLEGTEWKGKQELLPLLFSL